MHDWRLLTLPPNKWKWRMRHSAVTFAEEISGFCEPDFDLIFASDMLNLAEFLGLAPSWVRNLPVVAYFHENQITYPVQHEDERDYHFNFMNITTGLAADAVWFNSSYHRDVFLDAAGVWLKKMPDFVPSGAVDEIAGKSAVYSPGVRCLEAGENGVGGALAGEKLHIVWAARWEHDKNPELFFEALRVFKERVGSRGFSVSVIGESFRNSPAIFEEARDEFADEIVNWGYADTREAYEGVLRSGDVLVSTAAHEFFGITVVEAMSAGVFPLVPRELAYPEVVGGCVGDGVDAEGCFHDSSAEGLAKGLMRLARRECDDGSVWENPGTARRMMAAVRACYDWGAVREKIDRGLVNLVERKS